MPRLSRDSTSLYLTSLYLTFAAAATAAVVLLAQPAPSEAHSYRAHDRSARHQEASAYRRRQARAIADETAGSAFSGPFGGYADAAAAAQYREPNARHYFGYGSGQSSRFAADQHSALAGLVEQQASANGVPASLVHRVIMRESGYNPRAAHAGNFGLMQIRLGTARAMGYGGSAAGLLDAETNMTYAVRYLAGAYRAAGGNETRAVALYARGYNAPRVQGASFDAASFDAPAASLAPAQGSGPSPRWFAYVPPNAKRRHLNAGR
jgi:soluble lytic murein transglycosylase-like protein